jgi:hypothetical protein
MLARDDGHPALETWENLPETKEQIPGIHPTHEGKALSG